MKKLFMLVFLLLPLILFLFTGCSQSQSKVGKNIIKSTNFINVIQSTTSEGLKEKAIVKTKDILDPSRGGGIL